MPTLYMTRHGETEWNLEKRMQGWEDSPLTAKGRQNARDLGHRLREMHLDHLYQSDWSRPRNSSNDGSRSSDSGHHRRSIA